MLNAYWAYDFACDQPIEAILVAFNAAAPWQWTLRDSAAYGDYLNCRPQEHVRLRVHAYPQVGSYGTFVGLHDKGFRPCWRSRQRAMRHGTRSTPSFGVCCKASMQRM